ncbi:hypothetical protein FEM48_Zijuj12G0211200 [Ziziphus jujuba var. spinosa]|uniref:Uncharacterized protein n=1 Tax=Ziziphus jujuba var. spinosa TaxID=714518 RepID=A0A978UFJ8_ZIZJJ|nr:hypothetical protein FEM48_Zijuj12G0211200 [Ziziphus jujuba var. spinosa]
MWMQLYYSFLCLAFWFILNVRVLKTQKQIGVDDSIKTVANPLCIGVRLEDVDGIVAGLCGEERKHLSLATA